MTFGGKEDFRKKCESLSGYDGDDKYDGMSSKGLDGECTCLDMNNLSHLIALKKDMMSTIITDRQPK